MIPRRRLGGTGLAVSEVSFGTWALGGDWGEVSEADGLAGIEVAPLDSKLGKRAGMLLARTGGADAIDAAVICLARDGDDILTSDPADLLRLAHAAGTHVELIPI